MQSRSPPVRRRDALLDALQETVTQLDRCRASEIPEGYIEDYIALDWLKWEGGALRLTASGDDMCQQLSKSLAWRKPDR